MASGNFHNCLAVTLGYEGGYSNNPHDPGGATMNGIIQTEYDSWRKARGLSIRPVKFIDASERDEIYEEQYWTPLKCEDLPLGIDLMVFDLGVNSGIVRSAKHLQQCLGVNADGHIGLITLGAVRKVNDRTSLIKKLSAKRLSFLQALKNWKWFGRGWRNRVVDITAKALKMSR